MSSVRFQSREIWWPGVAVLGIFLLVGALTRTPGDPALSLAGAAIAVGGAVLLSGLEGRSALAFALVSGAGVALVSGTRANDVGLFGLCLLVIAVVLKSGGTSGAVFCGASVAYLTASWLSGRPDTGWLPWMCGVIVCLIVAVLMDRQRALLAELREAQAGLAERSRAQERNRIARDLHDVIAHSLTVSLLHISGARLALEHDPEDAARSLAEAERLGRESLDEVRSIVGLMRSSENGSRPDLAPVPGLEGVAELVARFRNAGADVTLECDGEFVTVPATAGTTIYRIAQEALTNAAKHAPGSAVHVRLACAAGRVELTVDSSGPPGTANGGHGLSTMRERAEAIGGTCDAGPASGAGGASGVGWRVHASLSRSRPPQ
jgi:signal transduction histidine kinase